MFINPKRTAHTILICSVLIFAVLLFAQISKRLLKPVAAAPTIAAPTNSPTSFANSSIASSLMTTLGPCDSPQFAPAANFALGAIPTSVAVGDFNLDGKQDVAIANGGNITARLGNGDGTFQTGGNYGGVQSSAYGIDVGDFNADGKPDLVSANYGTNNISIFLGNGDGTFQTPVNYLSQAYHRQDVVVGDFNRDGKQDLAVANETGNNISILLGNGDGTFQSETLLGAGVQSSYLVQGDFNRDGNQDLAVANQVSNTLSILLGNGNGTFQAAVAYGLGTAVVPQKPVVGDFNGDGKLDIATANFNSDNLSVLLGNGDGSFAAATNISLVRRPSSVAIGDFNADGKQDLAVTNTFGGEYRIAILLGDGTGSFQPRVDFGGMPNPPRIVAVGDFNGDHKQDLITANDPNGPGSASILLNTTNTSPTLGTYPNAGPIAVGSSTMVTPDAVPGDDNSVASLTASAPGFTGTFSGDPATGKITISNAGPAGTYTVTVTARDDCNLTATKTFTLMVNSTPTITAGAMISRQQGSPAGIAAMLAMVGDADQMADSLTVTAMTVPSGITLGTINNNNGTVTATVAADCTATLSNNTLVLKVTDNLNATALANFIVNVTVNTAPTLTYGNQVAAPGSPLTINPMTGPSDNGSVNSIAVQSQGTYTGTINVNASGIVSLSNAVPVGIHTITIRATDNCGLPTDATFTLNILNTCGITVNPATLPSASLGVPFVQVLSASPTGSYTFSLSAGTLPPGLSIVNVLGIYSLRGTPTTRGTYNFTLKAKKNNTTCESIRNYTLTIP